MEPTEETPLMLKLGFEKYLDKLQEISSQASKDVMLGKASLGASLIIFLIFIFSFVGQK